MASRRRGERSAQAARVAREAVEATIVMLSPFAPHTMEELWQMYGHRDGLAAARWPAHDPEVAKAELLVIPVQVNGKLRGRISAAPGSPDEELERLALADANVRAHTEGKSDSQGRHRQGSAGQHRRRLMKNEEAEEQNK